MASESVTFREAAKLIRQGVNPEDVGDMPYIGLEHIEEGTLRLIGIGNAKSVTSTKFRFSKGDILFGKLRPYFRKVIRPNFDGVCSTDIWVVRSKEGIDQGYLYYWMASKDYVDFATQGSEGTKMPRAKWDHVGRFQRQRLGGAEQRAISHILGSLDDKIESNRRMNQTLEATARAIFKSWFVNFDPVRAKAEGSDHGLSEDIAAIFPDNFEDSEIEEVPTGWRVLPLSEVVNIIGGGTPKTKVKEYWGGDIPWFSVVDAPTETDVFVIDTEKHITELGVDKSSTKVLRKGTTIISARGTVGKCALVGRPMAMNQSCYGIQGKNGESDYFVYFTIRRQVSDLQRSGHGSVFNTITRDTFKTIRIACPPTNLTTSYEEIVQPLMELILANLHENATLTSLRDALLPKLISGELRVPDAERFVEEAGL
jgi:type I restriction enzyme S subunit